MPILHLMGDLASHRSSKDLPLAEGFNFNSAKPYMGKKSNEVGSSSIKHLNCIELKIASEEEAFLPLFTYFCTFKGKGIRRRA